MTEVVDINEWTQAGAIYVVVLALLSFARWRQ